MHKKTKYAALLLSWILIVSAVLGMTLAVVAVKTPALINTFLSGFDPTADLTIRKTIQHPFDSSYDIPDNDSTRFLFTVDLGIENAERTFGDFRTDSEGRLSLTLRAGSSVTIPELPLGTVAVVTEQTPGPGFASTEPQSTTIDRGENTVSVVNTYEPAPAENTLTVRGSKTLVGRDWQPGDRFVFVLEVKENGQWKELGQQIIEFTEESDRESFNTFDFTSLIRAYSLNSAGTHSFRVIEKEGSVPGITYDKTESKIQVTVGDRDMDGTLEIQSVSAPSANTTVRGHTVWIDFRNAYAPLGSAEVYLDITKHLTDTSGQNTLPAGFLFELYDEAGELLQTSQATDAEGKTEIRLIFETKHAGQSFVYTLKEVNAGQAGMTYDETQHTFRVDVSADGDGTVIAQVTQLTAEEPSRQEPDAAEAPEPSVPAPSVPAASEPPQTEPTEAAQNAEQVPLETEPEKPAVKHVSTAKAAAAAASAETADNQQQPAREAEPVQPDPAVHIPVAFTNIYEPEAASLPLSGTKLLTGRALKAEEFAFALYQTEEGFALAENAVPVQTVRNDAGGAFAFEELVFTRTGWHYFLVTEDPSAALGGVTYDDARFQIRVFVADVGGKLSVQTVTVENTAGEASELIFRNVYRSAPAVLELPGRKTLSGRELKAEEFTFRLYEATYLTGYGFTKGQLYARSTNTLEENGEGLFTFSIEYPEPGTFHYIVSEAAGEETDMTYDQTEYGIEVVVKDDQAGQLRAEITKIVKIGQETVPLQQILFRNVYTGPAETEPDETTEETTEPGQTETRPDGPGLPGETEDPDGTEEPRDPTRLPQTGQLWWPVPILLVLGLAFVLIGLIRRKGTCYEDEKT